MGLTLVLGPRRSGKSRTGEALAAATGAPVTVIAPLTVTDDELAARVAAHRAARPPAWSTIESADVVAAMLVVPEGSTVLLDSLGTWVSEVLWRAGALEDGRDGSEDGKLAAVRMDAAVRTVATLAGDRSGMLIVVAEEAGWGPVPPSGATRLWLDVLGDAVQALSAAADRALLVVGGRTIELP